MIITYAARRENPNSKWPYRIVRIITLNNCKKYTHKLKIKFETVEQARSYISKHAVALDRFA